MCNLEKRKLFVTVVCNLAQVDICAVSETKLKPENGEESMREVIDQNRFVWLSRERKKQKSDGGEGGVGVLVRKSLGRISRVKSSETFDILWVQVELCSESLFVAAVYLPPVNSSRKVEREVFLRELEKV